MLGYSDRIYQALQNWLAAVEYSDETYQAKIKTRDFYLLRRIGIVDCILGLVKRGYVTGSKAENLVFKIYCKFICIH